MDDERDECSQEWTIYFGSDSSDDEYHENDKDYEEDKMASPEASMENGETACTGPDVSRSKTEGSRPRVAPRDFILGKFLFTTVLMPIL